MTNAELEQRIAELRRRPLLLVCRDRKGLEKVMTVEECRRTGSAFLHVAADDLDALLGAELGGDNLPVGDKRATKLLQKTTVFRRRFAENGRKPQTKRGAGC